MLRNSVVAPTNKKATEIPSPYYPFFLGSFAFGYDFGFSKFINPKIRRVAKCFSMAVSLSTLMMLMAPIYMYSFELWSTWNLIKALSNFLILANVKYSPCEFVADLGSNDRYSASTNVTRTTIPIMVIKLMYSYFRCWINNSCIPTISVFSSVLPYFSSVAFTYLISISQVIVLNDIRRQTKQLKSLLQEPSPDINKFLHNYIKLAGSCDKIKPFLNSMIIINLVLVVPKTIYVFWIVILNIKLSKQTWVNFLCDVLMLTHDLTSIYAPAVVTEMINVQSENIVLLLNEQMVNCDGAYSARAGRVLKYVRARRLCGDICNVVPQGAHLVFMLFSLVSTYLIVVIQFTHIYD